VCCHLTTCWHNPCACLPPVRCVCCGRRTYVSMRARARFTPIVMLVMLSILLCVCVTWQAYDQHLNMVLGDVEETITTVEVDDETYEEIIKVSTGCVWLWLVSTAVAAPTEFRQCRRGPFPWVTGSNKLRPAAYCQSPWGRSVQCARQLWRVQPGCVCRCAGVLSCKLL
jgi:hypothetical protein